jgi:hypothetical protein
MLAKQPGEAICASVRSGFSPHQRHLPWKTRLKIEKPIYAIALLLVALSLMFELLVPAGDHVIAVAAELSGLATWIVPALLLALSWNQKPRTSLAGVGFAISLFVVAASFSAISLWLALLTFVFAQDASRAWLALLIIAVFWVSIAALLVAGDLWRRHKERSE